MALKAEKVYLDCPNFKFWLTIEDFEGVEVLFLHLDFKKWSLDSYKHWLGVWDAFKGYFLLRGSVFYAVANHDNEKVFDKFVKRLGFKEFKAIPCPDGKTRTCYVIRDTANGLICHF